jgi:uncharacterized protein YbaP (TraB family)
MKPSAPRLRRLASVTCLVALAALAANACASAPAAAPAPTPSKPSLPLLWRIEGPQGKAWIYGTLHTGGAAFVPGVAWAALAGSTTFVMETDIDHIDQNDLIARALLPDGQTLDQLMSPKAWKQLVEALRGTLPEAQLKRFKPWFVSVVLAQSFLPGGEATDQALKRRATEQGAKLAFLETWQEQLDALEAGTDVASLELMLDDLDKARHELDDLIEAYRSGDTDAIVKLTTDPAAGMSEQARETLLYARNRNWVPKIEALVSEGGAFIAVGAGHIPGPGGVAELLTARGYKVTRIGLDQAVAAATP